MLVMGPGLLLACWLGLPLASPPAVFVWGFPLIGAAGKNWAAVGPLAGDRRRLAHDAVVELGAPPPPRMLLPLLEVLLLLLVAGAGLEQGSVTEPGA